MLSLRDITVSPFADLVRWVSLFWQIDLDAASVFAGVEPRANYQIAPEFIAGCASGAGAKGTFDA
jgi:hypothetical protein